MVQGWRASFSNLTIWPNASINNVGSGLPLRETYLDGANVTLNFAGTAVYLCLTPLGSSFTFTVDNNPVSTTGPASDPACVENGGQVMAYADGLTYGSHSATVRVNSEGSTDFLFHGGVVTVGLNGTNPVVQRIDDTDPGWSYQPAGAWSFSNVSNNDAVGDYNTTRHWMCSYGPSYTASYTFNGSSAVQLLGLLNLNIGPYTIHLNEQSYVYNGSDLWRESQQVLFFKSTLDPTKEYTITLVNYDQAAPDAQQPVGPDFYPCATVDELILTKTTPGAPSVGGSGNGTSPGTGSGNDAGPGAGSGGASPVGAIVGGVVGGIALCILCFLLWFFWRRRRAQALSVQTTEIDPMPDASMGEVTPYIFSDSTYSPIPTSDAMSRPQEEPHISGYTQARSPLERRTGKATRYVVPVDQSAAITPHAPAGARPDPSSTISSASVPTASPDPPPERAVINGASTQELVAVLNRRLRREYAGDNDEMEPPDYEPVD
ncbi:hypothetical protein CALVIDRAFT_594752 [Calocera viscosa TUFC12733]|uniref:Uncharacterized protein n=1 Tax=Calocera viscosa (strain TUFC12733) TaxID=1330018 RepID=A0A167RT59_CALVF|nr:hypothetical protein CALVIDRAFT_594752 [Calocera viscosa TUFC12733]